MADISVPQQRRRITVKLKDMGAVHEMHSLVHAFGGHTVRTFKRFPYMVLEIPETQIKTLEANNTVEELFEDGQVFALEQQLPWGVDRVDAELVHSRFSIKGYGVKVAVLDTGIDLNHPDLRVFGGKSFVSATYQDDHGHGTHVAGTIAAQDNGEGVVGIAPEAQLYALKVLNSSGAGNWSDVAAAIEWCIDNGMDVISMSLGGTSGDPLIQAAVAEAYGTGILLTAAAGNSGTANGTGDTVVYPARYPEVIAVAAVDSNDNRALFSSTGPAVELAAPGVNIPSTYLGSSYKTLSGTSMAAPHVAGLAALVKSTYPFLTNQEIRQKLVETANDLGNVGRDPWYGYGLINAPAAVAQEGPDTSPPQIFFKSPSVGETVSGVVKIEILAQDLSGVKNLKLNIDGQLKGEWSTPPYVYFWDTTKLQPGEHYFTVEAVDGSGNVGQVSQQVVVGATVKVFEPRDGFVVRDDVAVKATFSDNAVVVRSELYVDGILRDSKTPLNNQVEFTWNSREVKIPGTSRHIIGVTAVTDSGLKTVTNVNVLMRNPVIRIIQPEPNSVVNFDRVWVVSHATDDGGIEKVEFYIDNKLADTVFSKPYQTYLATGNLAVGNHFVKSVAYSKTGHVAESNELIIKKPAEVKFLNVNDGDVIGGKFKISVGFSVPVGRVSIYIDNKFFNDYPINNVDRTISFTLNTTGYQDLSAISVKATALTIQDQVLSTGTVNVTIDNYIDLAPPAVRILSPANSYLIDNPMVEILAEASDDTGISYVEFYLNEAPLEKVFAAPYKMTHDFSAVPAGKHYLTAKAEDVSGNLEASERVEVLKPTVVTIVRPAGSSKVTGTVSEFELICSDQISGTVKLYIDGVLVKKTLLDEPTAGPVVIPYSWDTTQYPDFSAHTIAAEVYTFQDSVPSKGTAVVTVDNSADIVPPAVRLIASQTGVVQGTVIFTAEATDNRGIERVEFYINGNLVDDQVFLLIYQWDGSAAKTGNYSFVAKAYDTSGNYSLSNVINLSVPTKVSVISPVPNTHIVGAFNDFTAVFGDPVAGSVDLYVDGEYKATANADSPTTGPVKVNYNWDTSIYPELSQHEILITAETSVDRILSSGRTSVYVDNRTDITPPVIKLSASGYGLVSGETVTFLATACDEAGIKQVEFYREDNLIASVSKAPYEFKWDTTGQPVGRYRFTARAYDYAGNAADSNQIIIGIGAGVTITSPYDNQVVSGIVSGFTAQFSDPVSGYAYLYIDGVLVAGKNIGVLGGPVTIEYNWDTTGYENGSPHEIKIRAYTAAGQVRSEGRVRVTIQKIL